MELRDYQQLCVQKVVDAFKGNPAGDELLVLPTAAGKTVIFAHVIYTLQVPTLIVAHTDELLNQAAEKYRMVKPDAIIGKVGGGLHQYGGEVTVASVDTISRPNHLQNLKNFKYGLVVIDEAHRSAAPKYQKVLEPLQGCFVLKVTATPDRLDGKPISKKSPLYERDIIAMVLDGYLSSPRAIAIRTETSLDNVATRGGDFDERELEGAINTPARNRRVVEAYQQYAPGRLSICFGVSVNHAEQLAYAFNDQGINAVVVSGETSLPDRKKIYSQFRSGQIQVICNVQVLTEGFDVPEVGCVIMARPTKSRALYIQCIGRGLRLAPDKENCIILDLTDNVLKHRLTPQTLGKAIGMEEIKDGETVEEAVKRVKEEKETLIRKLKEMREKDLQIELLNRLDWHETVNGAWMLDVGPEKHRLCLVPQKGYTDPGYDEDDLGGEEYIIGYKVVAYLAPDKHKQVWTNALPLNEAQQFAEREARKLLAGAAPVLIDRSASWRARPATEAQIARMDKLHIGYQLGTTAGEASDLLDQAFARKREKKKVLA